MITDTQIRALKRDAEKDGNDFLATCCARALVLPRLGEQKSQFKTMCESARHECERVIDAEVYAEVSGT